MHVIKLGGAAITHKNDFEVLNEASLRTSAQHIAEATRLRGFDTVVVHGAGSFGHFQASQYGVSRGWKGDGTAVTGFALTRLSVTKLNHLVVSALNKGTGLFLTPQTWRTTINPPCLQRASPLVVYPPVACGGPIIGSGDTIARRIAEVFQPDCVVFLTNVDGVFDRPPEEPNAQLLSEIIVQTDGSWAAEGRDGSGITLTSAAHDTTGGIATKVQEAAAIATVGVDVLIARAGTENARLACLMGRAAASHQEQGKPSWRGTRVRLHRGDDT